MQSYHLVETQIQHFILQRYVDAAKSPLSLVLCEDLLIFMNIPGCLGWLSKYVEDRTDEVHNQIVVSIYYYETPIFISFCCHLFLAFLKQCYLFSMHVSVLVGSLVVMKAIFKTWIHLLLVYKEISLAQTHA